MAIPLPLVSGTLEDRVAQGSGMRRRDFRIHCRSGGADATHVVSARPIGGAGSADVTAFTDVALNNRVIPFGATPVAQLTQAVANNGTVQLRVRGFNMFHEYEEEITPVVSYVNKASNFIYLSKVFSWVTQVSFKSTGLDIAADTISLGMRWDWTRTNDAANEHIAGRNLGIPVPIRSGRIRGVRRVGNNRFRQRVGPTTGDSLFIANLDQRMPDRFFYPERHATATVSMSGVPLNNETITIDGLVYTWKAVLTATPRDVLIGGSASACLDNLSAALQASTGGAGVVYGVGTTAHPSVMPGPRGLFGGNQTLALMVREPGAMGNSIPLTEASTNLTITAFRDGVDSPGEVEGITVYDITGSAILSPAAITQLFPKQFAVGVSVDGWQGCAEKLHIISAASVAQWALTDNIVVDMRIRTADVRL